MTTMMTVANAAMAAATRIYSDELDGIIDRHFPAHSVKVADTEPPTNYHIARGIEFGYRIIHSASLSTVDYAASWPQAVALRDYWNAK